MQGHDRHFRLKRRLSDDDPTTTIVVLSVVGGILFLACLLYVVWTRCHCKRKAAARPLMIPRAKAHLQHDGFVGAPKTVEVPKHSIIDATSRDPMWMVDDTRRYFPTAEEAQYGDDDDDIYVSGYTSGGDIYLTGATDAMLFTMTGKRSEVSMISVGSSVE
ncbi:Aste57867_21760 [Aphanomyces stellatus]|uniref:Aste57867_21760 protein n=1 Tax=Aphanomyces stellatus TaxID=120398 RepID=A0A485LJ13_9STRA|nr:hypothetical protein As57867_021691 [Aphanomyces stellatus]VFT98429.1 Aste57867_21760 [Aphanomyces stellatus]